MRVIEDAATSVLASAAAVETHIAIVGFMAVGAVRYHFDDETALDLADEFLRKPKEEAACWKPWSPGSTTRYKNAGDLHAFAGRLCEALRAAPPWPAPERLQELRTLRNDITHGSVRPRGQEQGLPIGWSRPFPPDIALDLLEDLPVEELRSQAEQAHDTMLDACWLAPQLLPAARPWARVAAARRDARTV